jgi:hypothetical protein
MAVDDGLTDTPLLRETNARVRVALIGEGTQRARLPTQEADNSDGGPKSGAEPKPRCSGSAESTRRWRGSGPECFCRERQSHMWKREEGHSVVSLAEAGRGGRENGGGGLGPGPRGRREMGERGAQAHRSAARGEEMRPATGPGHRVRAASLSPNRRGWGTGDAAQRD